jgi:hypothetical protein
LVADFDAKEKAWRAKEQSMETATHQLQTELDAIKRKVIFSSFQVLHFRGIRYI